MHQSLQQDNKGVRWLRLLARGIGSIVSALWLLVGLIEALSQSEPRTGESTILATLMSISVAGVVVGWFREGLGGAILLVAAAGQATFAYFAAGHHKGFAMAISGGPFLIVGSLFLAYRWRSRPGRGLDHV